MAYQMIRWSVMFAFVTDTCPVLMETSARVIALAGSAGVPAPVSCSRDRTAS
jgi:hypothetical protein